MAKQKERVIRVENRLSIRLDNGEVADFVDEQSTPEAAELYSYVGRFDSIGYDVIAIQFYEGGSYWLLNSKTGLRTPANGVPVVSPKGDRMVATSVDLSAGFIPTRVEIWKIQGNNLVSEYAYEFTEEDWGPGDPVWVGDDRIVLPKIYLFDERRGESSLLLNGQRWVGSDFDSRSRL
jgi:hypothetical protein